MFHAVQLAIRYHSSAVPRSPGAGASFSPLHTHRICGLLTFGLINIRKAQFYIDKCHIGVYEMLLCFAFCNVRLFVRDIPPKQTEN